MNSKPSIIISGITGQDGVFLTDLFLKKTQHVIIGLTRDKKNLSKFIEKLNSLNHEYDPNRVRIIEIDLLDKNQLTTKLNKINNLEYVVNFNGPSSVYESITSPENYHIIWNVYKNLINFIEDNYQKITFFQANSSEMFGNNHQPILNENSIMNPTTPYAQSKYAIHSDIQMRRLNSKNNLISGILFNHISEFTLDSYLIPKIVDSLYSIKQKVTKSFSLGSLSTVRDWSHSEEIVKSIYFLLEQKLNDNFVIGSGKGTSINEILEIVSIILNVEYKKFLNLDDNLLRPNQPEKIIANPKKLTTAINFKPSMKIEKIIERYIDYNYK
jgi:GDPmannose 4,6-dehydratase